MYRGKRIREDDADMRTSKRNAGNRETTTRMKNAEWDEKEDREGNKKSNQKQEWKAQGSRKLEGITEGKRKTFQIVISSNIEIF